MDDWEQFWNDFVNASGDTGGSSDTGGTDSGGGSPPDTSGYGMNDRGLGTGGAGDTLTPEQVAALGPGFGDQLMKLLGTLKMTGSGGGLDLSKLLGLLGPIIGGVTAYNKTKTATNQVQEGIKNAQDIVAKTLGGASPFAPFSAAGAGALTKLGGMNWTPLAQGPLGQPSNMASVLQSARRGR